jgi:hypothetical protein
MSKDYNLKISTVKTKITAFKGKHFVRSKIEVDGEPDFDKNKIK